MTPISIALHRLHNQQIAKPKFTDPADVVAHLGAVQAQDYPAALWAVGLRTKGAHRSDIERAIADRRIIRTWPMRGTLHFMAGADARWMLDLLTPRANASGGWASRRKFLGLTEGDISKAAKLVTRALTGGKALTRPELYSVLERGGIRTTGQRGAHILGKLAHELLVCLGPHRGKHSTVVLLDEWLPSAKPLKREEALAKLASRYFKSHGPATVYDFAWWSGLKVSDAKTAIQSVESQFIRQDIGGTVYWMPRSTVPSKAVSDVHLLPPFDEYLVGYKDRGAVVDAKHGPKVFRAGNGLLSPVIVVRGKVQGVWGRRATKSGVVVTAKPFIKLIGADAKALAAEEERYRQFML